jgi:uncharacterized coiled-coil DUF342 family protein
MTEKDWQLQVSEKIGKMNGKLQSLDSKISMIHDEIRTMRDQIAKLRIQASLWGAIAAVVISVSIMLTKVYLTK